MNAPSANEAGGGFAPAMAFRPKSAFAAAALPPGGMSENSHSCPPMFAVPHATFSPSRLTTFTAPDWDTRKSSFSGRSSAREKSKNADTSGVTHFPVIRCPPFVSTM